METRASLVVAAMDLELVRLLRGAIRAADLANGGQIGPLGTIEQPPGARRDHFHPEPRFEPRPVFHPTPRFEPRPVIHPTPRIGAERPCPIPPAVPCPVPVAKEAGEAPLPPPWRMPAWQTSIPPAPAVKVHIHRTDVHNKGSLIDLFL
jgi:hypothetical protein